jgi:hypothetical protein
MATGKTSVNYDGDTYNYHFQKDGSAYRMYIADGVLYDGKGERVDASDGNTYEVIELNEIAYFEDDTEVTIKGASARDSQDKLPLSARVVVNSSGKVKKSGTVKIDGYRYHINNYRIDESKTEDLN